jgi:hypothetical protein
MSRKEYLNLLRKQPTQWIVESMESPSAYMTKTHIALHAIELRNRKGSLA